MQQPRYPDITVELSDGDGNAYAVISQVRRALRRAGVSKEEIEEFSAEATQSDYDNVLVTAMKWVDVG